MTKFSSVSILFLCVASLFASCQNNNFSSVKVSSEADSASYMYGVLIGKSLSSMGFGDLNVQALAKGIGQVFDETEGLPSDEKISAYLNAYFSSVQEKKSQENLEAGKAFLEKNKSNAGVITLDNGLQYQILQEGSGEKPAETDTVKVHYHGTLMDGTVFDSSVDRGEPVSFSLDMVIEGWQKIIPLMPKGSKWKVWIPTEMAYGVNVRPGGGIEPNIPLVFEIELLEINPKE